MQSMNNPGVSFNNPMTAAMPQTAKMPQMLPQQMLPAGQQAANQTPLANLLNKMQMQNRTLQAQNRPTFTSAALTNAKMSKLDQLSRQLDSSPTFSAFDNAPGLSKKMPEFPESAFDRLRNMMETNQQARNTATTQLSKQLNESKEKFFDSYSYETKTGQDGKPKLALDEQGRPQLLQGKEQFQQRVARQDHEAATKQKFTDFHNNTKEAFLSNEKQQVMTFLQNHRNELQNPAVQQELQRMLADSQKRGQQLKREQESQLWELDLPTEEMREAAKTGLKKLHMMEDEHKKMEDSSQEAHELIMYQEEVNKIALEEKKKLQFSEKDEAFLQNPENLLKQPAEPTLAELLPPYLTEALYNMGIYAIE